MEAIIKGDAQQAVDTARQGLDDGIAPLELMDKGFVPGINEVGELFESGQIFIPGLVTSAAAMEKATEIINAAIPAETETVQGRVVVGTVEGDMHDIGKTIVVALLKANGFDVLDLGRDVAMKLLLEHHAFRPEMIRRLVEEAQIGGQLQHPGIVPIYDIGLRHDNRPYFTMKLVRGETLARLLKRRNVPHTPPSLEKLNARHF